MSAEGNISARAAFLKAIGANAPDSKMAFGSTAVTGSELNIDTGLSQIFAVVATVKASAQGANEAGYVTVDYGNDGLLDLYAWDDGGAAATAAGVVDWVAIGR